MLAEAHLPGSCVSPWHWHVVQVVKIVVPVYYGSRYQCERVPKHAVLGFIKRYRAQMDASSAALMAASQKGQPAPQ